MIFMITKIALQKPLERILHSEEKDKHSYMATGKKKPCQLSKRTTVKHQTLQNQQNNENYDILLNDNFEYWWTELPMK